MAVIIALPKQEKELEPNLWICKCGSISFHFYHNGDLECTECELMHTNGHLEFVILE